MLKIRLQRVGRKHEPSFRLVLTDSKNSTKSGRFKEVLGSYDPRKSTDSLDAERIKYWLSQGVSPTNTVHNLLVKHRIINAKKINVSAKSKKTSTVKEDVIIQPVVEEKAVWLFLNPSIALRVILSLSKDNEKSMIDDVQFLEYVVKALVNHPDDIKIKRTVDEMGVLMTLDVHQDDMGKVIGRSGNTAKAIRILLRVVGMKNNARINLKINEPAGSNAWRTPNSASTPTASKTLDEAMEDLNLE